ncbi:MAG: hypothetical protein RLZZ621_2217, partial [Gemmatimonadota bacterium]
MRSPIAIRLATLLVATPVLVHAQMGGFRGSTPIKPGESCPPGMTEIRPLQCQAPQAPAPS